MTKILSLVGFGICSLLAATPAAAQEREDLNNDERAPIEVSPSIDSHGSAIREQQILRDSLIIKPLIVAPAIKPKPAEAKKKEEETLSYNFLYYIISKFKGSDVVD